ncbi:MAG TPA: cadherin domain-containing protein, partial [Caulifigura sp.]|nr:cadherin domain-containing protein [Caulifigura sp.]
MRRASERSTPAVVQSLETRQLPSAYTATAATYEAIDLEPGQTGVTTVLDGYLDAEAFVDLGTNTFTFYGTTYTGASALRVNPHGLIGFGPHNVGGSYVNSALNDPAGYSTSQPLIAPLWDDWATDYSSADAVLAKIDGNRLIIEWSQVTHWPDYPADTVTFQAILQLNTGSQSGGIVFNYVDLETVSWYANGVSATVGVRAADGTASPTVVSFDATHPLIGSGKAILLSHVDTALSQSSIVENQPSDSTVGTFTTAGDDEEFTYSLVSGSGSDDNASFQIVDGELRTTASFNFEAQSSYSIRVRTTDEHGGWCEQVLVISVNDVDEFDVSPPADVDNVANVVAENAANGTAVGVTASAIDEDGTTNTVTYSLSDDAGGRFTIDQTTGVVTVADSSLLNYESATSHTISVVATSADGSTSEADFVVSLTDVNEFEVSDLADTDATANLVFENAANGTLVGITAVASDADGTTNAVTYSLSVDAGGRFA